MLRKIYLELVAIRKELQAIRSSKESPKEDIIETVTKELCESMNSVFHTLQE